MRNKLRQAIISLLERTDKPVDVAYLLSNIRVNKTSIYRQMKTLVGLQEVSEIDLGDGKKRFELTSLGHHHHLVCLNCRSITEVNLDDDFTREAAQIEKKEKFKVIKHSLEFFGYCAKCH